MLNKLYFSLLFVLLSGCSTITDQCTPVDRLNKKIGITTEGTTQGHSYSAYRLFNNDFSLLKSKKGFYRVQEHSISVEGVVPYEYTLTPTKVCNDDVEVIVKYRGESFMVKVPLEQKTLVYDDHKGYSLSLTATLID